MLNNLCIVFNFSCPNGESQSFTAGHNFAINYIYHYTRFALFFKITITIRLLQRKMRRQYGCVRPTLPIPRNIKVFRKNFTNLVYSILAYYTVEYNI